MLDLNVSLLGDVIEAVEENASGEGRSLTAGNKARFIVLLYELAKKKEKMDREAVFRMVRSALGD